VKNKTFSSFEYSVPGFFLFSRVYCFLFKGGKPFPGV
jgi:hypothetical protein